MFTVQRARLHDIGMYGKHLKELSDVDKLNRFGYNASNFTIDQLILNIVYHPRDHEMWVALDDDTETDCGWGHMAKNEDGTWELAVSVDSDFQRKGVGSKLIAEMLAWAKFHKISEVYMHCIEDNRVIQHLATKHKLKTKERGGGERTAAIEVPMPNVMEAYEQMWKEHLEITEQLGNLRAKLFKLWTQQK